ncbi:hypothetical protein QMK19_20970 [Streptomyces sp. H10-C2]|uniref:hypothetical protein n=1 Tax=unclassified Streptomyces TaxID=2593676 RepID=UPI0024B9774D|nr:MULTISPECIES: hypothetical protein [unclassified Streptomyces]MDJ0344446.1 hypothetical protein [Streptomyces sp. PH10-H1]MDJ0372078.1 hypothetical protein [Streptomyces sp. H10-C2]
MTQSHPQPPEHPTGPDEAAADTVDTPARRRSRLVRLTRHGRTRWVALGLVVLIGGDGAAAVAAAEHGHEERTGGGYSAEDRGSRQGKESEDGRTGSKTDKSGDFGRKGHETSSEGSAQAPAPLPTLPATQAVDKATAAVSGGKVESLRVVVQQGGGSAWQAVVLGPDGVRHAVALAGNDGTVTSNTVDAEVPNTLR